MADTSIVGRDELAGIAAASGYAIWEIEQVMGDGLFKSLVSDFRAGNLGVIVNPQQALESPSLIGQTVQAAVERTDDITTALGEGLTRITAPLREFGLQAVVLAVAVGIVALVIMTRR